MPKTTTDSEEKIMFDMPTKESPLTTRGAKPNDVSPRAKVDTRALFEKYLATHKPVSSGNGRLLFALDATASRAPTWAVASDLTIEMFRAAGSGLSMSLCFYRGAGEFRATNWVTSGEALVRPLRKIEVESGYTQIARTLRHALRVHAENPIAVLVFVGDSCEERPEELAALAAQMGAESLPSFMFLEGEPRGVDNRVEDVFRVIAKKSGGEFFWFGLNSPADLRKFTDTLAAVARLAVGDSSAIAMLSHNK